jgi:predicted DNA-binding transcriptional regulator AlpA
MRKLPRLLTLGEVAEMLGVDKATIVNWMETRKDFPSGFRLSPRIIRFEETEVVRFRERSPDAG